MIKDIQTASFFLKDGLNDNSSFRWCFCPGDEGGGGAETGGGGTDAQGQDDPTDLASADPGRGPAAVAAGFAEFAGPQTTQQAEQEQESFANAIADAMAEGRIGYNDAVALGYVDLIDAINQNFDRNIAKSVAERYGLEYDPKTGTYKGPGSFMANISEMVRGAGLLAANIVDMMPGPFGIVQGLAGLGRQDSFAGLIGQARGQSREEQAPSLASRVGSYMDEVAASQRDANMAARGLTDPDTAGIIDDYEEEAAQKGAFSTSDISGVTAPSDISGVTAPSDISGVTAPTNTTTGFDDIDFDGNEFIPLAPAIPSVPSVAPQPAAEVVRPPVTRTAATDNFSILVDTYGPEIAAQLLPNRTV